ncbi:MAG: hypothetical protein ACO3EZ_15410, partial [Prochlorotrichaceae cyanobacterium]
MAVVIVGSPPSGQKILRSSVASTDVDGLVTLTETYTIRRADVATLEPDRNETFSAISTSGLNYQRMQVETTRVDPMDGGLASLSITYVGMTTNSGLPPAYITAVGQPGVGVFGADAAIVVRYITQDSLFSLLQGGNISLALGNTNLTLPTKRLIPTSINGTAMPPNPRQREYRRSKTPAELAATAPGTRTSGAGFTISGVNIAAGFYPNYEWLYAGYVQSGISFQRRGIFNQIEEQFTEYFNGS